MSSSNDQHGEPVTTRRAILQSAAALNALGLLTIGGTMEKASAATVDLVLQPATEAVTPFQVAIPETALADLKGRLAATRWPERETVSDWSQGVPLGKLQPLIDYWRSGYDLRRLET